MNYTSNNSNVDQSIEKCWVSFIIHFEHPSSYVNNSIAVCILNVFLSIAGIIFNTLVLFIFWKSAKMRSKMSNFTIMVLSTIDLGVVTTVHPLFVFQRINELLGTSRCPYVVSYYFTGALLSGLSAWTLFVINTERYTAIVYPLWHHVMVTKRRFLLACLGFWTIYIFNMVLAFSFYSHHANVVFSASLTIMCLTSTYTYLSIFRTARQKMRSELHQGDSRHKTPRETCKKLQGFLHEVKMAKMYVSIVSLSFISYLPAGVVFAVQNPEKEIRRTRNNVALAYPWLLTFCSISSTLNCLIFFWANRDLKKEGHKIVSKYFGRRSEPRFSEHPSIIHT